MSSPDELPLKRTQGWVFAPYRRIVFQHTAWLCGVVALGIVDTFADTRWRNLDLAFFGVAALLLYFLPKPRVSRPSEIPELPTGSRVETTWHTALRVLLDTQVLLLLAMTIGGIFLPFVGAVGAGAAVSQIAVFLKVERRLPIFVQLEGPWYVPGMRRAWSRGQLYAVTGR